MKNFAVPARPHNRGVQGREANQRTHFYIALAAILFFTLILSRDSLAWIFLQKFSLPQAALFLVKGDDELSLLLGNYYFGMVPGQGAYDPQRAERAYKKAVALNPRATLAHFQLARIYFLRKELDKALQEINKELELNPENFRSLYVRGLIYGHRVKLGDLESAEKDFRRFVQWAPLEWAGHNDLAWVLLKRGEYRLAKEAIQNSFSRLPEAKENPWLLNSLGVAELNLREYDNAKSSLENALLYISRLTLQDWQNAYPGNDPRAAEAGLSAFRGAIQKNLERAKSHAVDKG